MPSSITPPSASGAGETVAEDAATVATSETTASTTYTDLATVGPAVTLVVPASGEVWVDLSARLSSSGANAARAAGVAVSGASTVAAADARSTYHEFTANFPLTASAGFLMAGLTPGESTFTMQYRTSAGTLTASNRNIRVRALP